MPPFPPLALDDWRPTRDRLWACARLLGKVRSVFTARQRHWSHISLQFGTLGPTTGPIQAGTGRFEIGLDLVHHRLNLLTSTPEGWSVPIGEVTTDQVLEALEAALGREVLAPLVSADLPVLDRHAGYEPTAAKDYLAAMGRVDSVLRTFRGGLHGEVSTVQLWPHHFDLAVLWLTGRQVAGVDPSDEDLADESANFGFSTGDEGIPGPYFYATVYPRLRSYAGLTRHAGSVLQEQGWQGVRLDYERLTRMEDPEQDLLGFLTSVHRAAAAALASRAEQTSEG